MAVQLYLAVFYLLVVNVICKKTTLLFLQSSMISNPVYVSECRIVVNPGNGSVDIDLNVLHRLNDGIRAKFTITGVLQGQLKPVRDIKLELPICDLMNNSLKFKSVTITNWSKNFFKQGTLPAKCPILPGCYTWRKLTPRKEHMPDYVIGGIYRIRLVLYTSQRIPGLKSSADFVDKEGRIAIIRGNLTFTIR